MRNTPQKIIYWDDALRTDAVGWIVIHNLVNGISGGGLFMSNSASLKEVQDLAYTMSYKNSLQSIPFGGGKGGIRFNPKDPEAKGVLKRFIEDNKEIIRELWCTGGDVNTSTNDIIAIINSISGIRSPFECLGNMLSKHHNIRVNFDFFHKNLEMKDKNHNNIVDIITGISVGKSIDNLVSLASKPKILIQGLGNVGMALAIYGSVKYDIVGVCEQDWFITNKNGFSLDFLKEIKNSFINTSDISEKFNISYKMHNETDEEFLGRFLSVTNADVFSPCATRYVITDKILSILKDYTFKDVQRPYIIAGANDIFKQKNLVSLAENFGIQILPEWVSNCGAALLFMETMKQENLDYEWAEKAKAIVSNRLDEFFFNVFNLAKREKSLWRACHNIISKGEINGFS